jgi:hypothetical protein
MPTTWSTFHSPNLSDELVSTGPASAHHALPQNVWLSIYLREASGVGRAIKLLRLSYEFASLLSQ